MQKEDRETQRKYDNPIPKPPDEMFDDFLRSTEAKLVTRRFDVNSRRSFRPIGDDAN